MDIKQLKADLLVVYLGYLKNTNDAIIKEEAAKLHTVYANSAVVLDKKTAQALHCLVDIAFETGIKLSEERIKEFIEYLQKG